MAQVSRRRDMRVAALLGFAALAWLAAPTVAFAQQRPAERQGGGSGLRSINAGFVKFAFGAWTAKIADGGFDTATGRTIRWFPHDSDSSVVAALSAGRLDVGLVGHSVAASAIARGLDLRAFYVLCATAESEGLLVSGEPGAKLTDVKSLQGKVIAVPFGSTPHFRLLEGLKRWGASVSSMRIVNLQTTQIAEAWRRGEIDAAMVSEPLLGQLAEQRGRLMQLPSVPDLKGLAVFVATGEFIAQHVVFLSRFIDVVARSDQAFSAGGAAPSEEGPEVKSIALLTGMAPSVVAASIDRYRPVPLDEQALPGWLGGGADAGLMVHFKAASEIWRWAGRLTGAEPDFSTAMAPDAVQMAVGYQR